ncbi:hypothetical protein BVY01_04475 [bacterium I07]|nr:hypothetical protein BVY01_04475 [bacterium I07]
MIGKIISHYKILTKLGEGGMGIVYKAQDTKLDRIVALKFLPHDTTISETDRARFLQEAKAASAINNANVCTIHDIQEYDGKQFIVMEYVEGETLGKKLKNGALEYKTAIYYAIQIAEALQAAHEKGIIHRDIKSENIMVTPKNQIKVMDFGLAKLKGSLKLTKTSSTLGTVSYMSPEQILGKEVDARSDIFSFGVVLYEMLSGELPFKGEYEAAVTYAIVNEEPEPIHKLSSDLPSELLHLLNRSIEKDPDVRYRNMTDIIVELVRSKNIILSLNKVNDVNVQKSSQKNKSLISEPYFKILIPIFLVALCSIVYLQFNKKPLLPPCLQEDAIVKQITFEKENTRGCVSPSGEWLVFYTEQAEFWNVKIIDLTDSQSKPVSLRIPQGRPASIPFWSPDSKKIALYMYTEDGQSSLIIWTIHGVLFKQITVPDRLPHWFEWSPDNKHFACTGGIQSGDTLQFGLMLFNYEKETDYQFLYTTPNLIGHFNFSPDGRHILFLESMDKLLQTAQVKIFDIENNQVHGPIGNIRTNIGTYNKLAWSPNENFIVYAGDEDEGSKYGLSVLEIDPEKSVLKSIPTVIEIGRPGDKLYHPKFSEDGNVLSIIVEKPNNDLSIMPFNQTNGIIRGDRQLLTMEVSVKRDPIWFPNGEKIIYSSNKFDNFDLYVYDIALDHSEIFFGTDSSDEMRPMITPDHRFISYYADEALWKISPDGLSNPIRLTDDSIRVKRFYAWGMNDNTVFVILADSVNSRGGNLVKLDLDTGIKKIIHKTFLIDFTTDLCPSPDGRYLAVYNFLKDNKFFTGIFDLLTWNWVNFIELSGLRAYSKLSWVGNSKYVLFGRQKELEYIHELLPIDGGIPIPLTTVHTIQKEGSYGLERISPGGDQIIVNQYINESNIYLRIASDN